MKRATSNTDLGDMISESRDVALQHSKSRDVGTLSQYSESRDADEQDTTRKRVKRTIKLSHEELGFDDSSQHTIQITINVEIEDDCSSSDISI